MTSVVAISTLPLIPSLSKISSVEEKESYWNSLINDWGLPSHIKHFPGTHPVSMERKDLGYLKETQHDFLVSLKSDGVRHIMYMTFRPGTNRQPVCLLIDRARNMYEIEVWANEDYYNGTIIDGELLWILPEETQTKYLAFDIIKLKGELTSKINYSKRLRILDDIIYNNQSQTTTEEELDNIIEEQDKLISKNNMYNLTMEAKRFTPLNMISKLWSDRLTTMYRHDGLIFTKDNEQYKLGSGNKCVYKWKQNYSIDVLVNNTDVYANCNASEKLIKIEKIFDIPVVLIENKIHYNNDDIIECDLHFNEKIELFPMRKRNDKPVPNTLKTIESACTGLLDNITIDEFEQLF